MTRIRLTMVAAVLAAVVVGCAGSSQSSVSDFVKKWNENSLSTIMHSVLGTSTGNKGEDGVIDSAKNIGDQDDAAKTADEAVAKGDTATLDGLIAKYPADTHFRNLRGAVALLQGDTQEFVSEFSFSAPGSSTAGREGPITDKIETLTAAGEAISSNFVGVNQCDEYFGSLSQLYRQRFEITHKQADLDAAASYDTRHAAICPTLQR